MTMLRLTLKEAKANFFDSTKVQRAVDAAERQTLRKFGSLVRLRARHSIRKRRKVSKPGNPPHSHVGLLRNGILFAYDERRKTVVIGAVLLRPWSQVPALLEYGGYGKRIKKNRPGKGAYWRARPYMRPAFEKELSRMPEMFRNSLGRV
jgi:stalled ribosome alternative rescue factor ArfA